MYFQESNRSAVLMVDNGSLRPASTLCLRRIARLLSGRMGFEIEPVSLLHSSRVAKGELGGIPAEIFESAVRDRHRVGLREIFVLPLFFGPSAALTTYLPERIAGLGQELPGLRMRVGRPLVDPEDLHDGRVAKVLSDHVREAWLETRISRGGRVILVDHGSPQRAVAEVRDHIARKLQAELAGTGAHVTAASMERRPGPEYDFNDPLLRSALENAAAAMTGQAGSEAPRRIRPVTLAMLFFSPGRHAGPGGDIETICREVEAAFPGVRTLRTKLVGEHPLLIEILADRLSELMSGGPANGQTAD